jgi:phosphoribosylformylglycinamidine synthase
MTTNQASDAAIVRVKGTEKALALTTDCNSSYVFADPYIGGMIAVAEASRNIICSGGEPVAITNCLNFGNPYNKEVYYQFVHALKGMGDACSKFETPVTGGNVSFYNHTVLKGETVPVYPTPTIGMLGLLDDASNQMTMDFKEEGDLVFLIGKSKNDIGSSEYLRLVHDIHFSNVPYFNLDEEYAMQQAVKQLITSRVISSAHDVSEGGLFVTLMESAMQSSLGFEIQIDDRFRRDAFLFGESQGRVVVSINEIQEDELNEILKAAGVPFQKLGTVTAGNLQLEDLDFGHINDWKAMYDNALSDIMEG